MIQLGDFKVFPLADGHFYLDGGLVFGLIPRVMWSKHNPPDDKNLVPLYVRPMLVDTGEKRILFDAGIGDRYGAKFAKIYGVQREEGQLLQSLKNEGYAPEDITDVVFSHLHFDHCGGASLEDKDGIPRLAFPNAVYYSSPNEYTDARNTNPRTKGSYRADFIEPIAASGHMHLIRFEGNILPGVTALRTPGHTADHYSFLIQSEGQHLIFWADLMPLRVHMHPTYSTSLDTHPMMTMESKQRLIKRAVDEGWHYHYFYHEMQPVVSAAEVEEHLTEILAEPEPTGLVL
jgi:glyoxylase-like metal-dependent hydrolase (beta-lactamase superfamily II)